MKSFLSVLFVFLFANVAQGAGTAVTYTVDGKEYEGYYVDAGKNADVLYLVHDWDGLTDYEVKRAEMLADLGYSVFATDLFGKGVRPVETKDKKQLTGALYSDRAAMRKLLSAGLSEAKKYAGEGAEVVAFGYCFGGAAVLELARSGEQLTSFVAFHGGLTVPEGQDYSKTSGEVVIFHGTADASVSMADFAHLAESLEKSGVVHEMVTYSGAPHAFTVFGSERYREDADKKSWKRFTEYLAETLK